MWRKSSSTKNAAQSDSTTQTRAILRLLGLADSRGPGLIEAFYNLWPKSVCLEFVADYISRHDPKNSAECEQKRDRVWVLLKIRQAAAAAAAYE